MVSTRGIKARFIEGERVLCYEPDPTKAKVLYESKVLQIVFNKDGRGRKQLEYLIHFQGWNASWDRCVDEDLVLKDTEENRILQKTLMENAHIKLKEKKKKRRLSDTIREIVQDRERQSKRDKGGSETGSQTCHTDDDDSASLTSDAESLVTTSSASGTPIPAVFLDSSAIAPLLLQPSGEEVYAREFPIDIPATLKTVLERDHLLIKEKSKVLQLPHSPAALSVLESYVIFFAARYLARTSERRRSETKLKEKAYLTLDLCKEVMDGLRVCFDFHCTSHLLYVEEQAQAARLATADPPVISDRELNTEHAKELDKSRLLEDKHKGEESGGRRLTRSGVKPGVLDTPATSNSESGRSTPLSSVGSSQQPAPVQRNSRDSDCNVAVLWPDLSHWSLLPQQHRKPGTPTLMYGPLHLLRLFVKLPEILYRMNLPPEKRKIILKHIQLFLEYLDVHNQDFFSEAHYVDATG